MENFIGNRSFSDHLMIGQLKLTIDKDRQLGEVDSVVHTICCGSKMGVYLFLFDLSEMTTKWIKS